MSALPLHRAPAHPPAPRPRATPKAPDLRVVTHHSGARPSIIGRVGVTLLVLLFVSVFGLVVFQAVLAQSQRHLDDLRRDLTAQQQDAKALRLRLATAEAPDRVAAAAKTRLGMIPPSDIVYLEPSPTDDAKAAYDPSREPTTTTTTTTTPVTVAQPTWTPPTTVKVWTPPTTVKVWTPPTTVKVGTR